VNSNAAKVGLALNGAASDPLMKTLSVAGYDVHMAPDLSRVQTLVAGDNMDAWVFDVRSEEVYELLRTTGQFLLPADNPPNPADGHNFVNWADGLLKQLDAAMVDAVVTAPVGNKVQLWSEVEAVWMLAGSAGATTAIQQFLNGFSRPPPVAFIYAQHYAPDKQHQLESFTLQNQQFSLCVGEGVHTLTPGQVIMIPPSCTVTLGSFGHIASTRSAWGGHYTPDINELLILLTASKPPSAGVIIFSGMGDDGADALAVFNAAGGRIWTQSPESAVCQGMPQAALNTGLVHRSGTPQALSSALERLYSPVH
jgi:chemosensory pili system protein ChpB (putative protein-glutamate methylesterase)